jgi:drug/metabolite transporter (DMT)-like permease
VGVAAATMLLTSAISGKVWPESRPGLWAKLLALALIGQVIPFLLLGKAATLTTSADMALMMGAQPIFVFLFGRFLGSRDRWTWPAAFGLALGFVGVAVAFWSPGANSGAHSVLGRAFALAAGFFYGTGAIISGAATREIGAVRAVTASMTISTLVLTLIGLMFGNLRPIARAAECASDWPGPESHSRRMKAAARFSASLPLRVMPLCTRTAGDHKK